MSNYAKHYDTVEAIKFDGCYAVKEPNGFCYLMPADIFEFIHNKMDEQNDDFMEVNDD